MIQLHVLAGGGAGRKETAASFPFSVGRSARNSLVLGDAGIFEEHFEVQSTSEGFLLAPKGEAVLSLNGEPSRGDVLRNGDIIGAGLAKVQFWLGPLRQKGLKSREIITWLLIAAVGILEIYFFAHLIEMARS